MPLNIRDLSIAARQFEQGERIPDAHAANGGDTAPDLEISGIPAGTVELAVVCHDPDAPLPRGFTHWTVYGITPSTARIGSGSGGGPDRREGPNTLGENAYAGPNPPPGHGTHHYYFWVYALDTRVEGAPSREAFLADYAGNIIEQNRIVGTYSA
ncbi:PEBP family protein [Streptomonospora alba]|uniref:PEBP family protein n=1 Tax=Streptomonospora alba TaxID=183763 RepID=A0A0C2G468_9ACTN|nr:YbhB/YbcL family Raf kinase inhibitor-like protein [Streptomonospora alba]KIH98053.1 PEBP family protein [Streptomonospora alba]